MTLVKTIVCEGVIPSDVLSRLCLKLIVLTDDEELVSLADTIAQQEPFGVDRIVVWIHNIDTSVIRDQIPDIDDLDNIIAFSLSTINKVGMIITSSSIIDLVELDSAFIEAGKTEIN